MMLSYLEGYHLKGYHLKGYHLKGHHLEGYHLEGYQLEGHPYDVYILFRDNVGVAQQFKKNEPHFKVFNITRFFYDFVN